MSSDATLLALAAILALGGLVLFAYLYWREWSLNRAFRHYQLSAQIPPEPGHAEPTPDRPSLVSSPRPENNQSEPLSIPTLPEAASSPLPATPTLNPDPALSNGTLNISADDSLREIFIDGEFVGMVPAKLSLPGGDYIITLKGPGGGEYRKSIRIIPGAEVSLRPPSQTSQSKI